ncbi:hypothetical protein [Rhizobium sp. Root482]|uniref:hypothetical protein n=1 Tax=Rhizobium sp. Root482 TaxID=1736543 RepID=UPI0006FEF117|nr:hypothetical protein [Rhizobium sp. Root482]KQY19797.1 hypothetical protein ASD31_05180 [Rhizobium sp. Root482]
MDTDPTVYGDESFEFREWVTPFSDLDVLVAEVGYAPDSLLPDAAEKLRPLSLFKESGRNALTIRLCDNGKDSDVVYKVCFETAHAFRIMDEIGLMELWQQTKKLGGRPARTSFQVRNHLWCRESPMSFFQTDGWAYVIASIGDCVEIVSPRPPVISREDTGMIG